ncbi:beta-ketoacyl-[acyl-carrier-protein] synthase family protein [Pelosinus baikalensis]|uniref:Beta-ketoacyl-[acyl-carrier-protein] synthase family protein n=1 Tax=Pelosinus baikalensis TaxID=2892015 RepID=A0ABS8I0K9_9FIRM|nr:beta-ketoacyl-[acyl-carrier-protein] synthase family protein [Pelosinus baikalensis]MCC5468461.1 beta-ketoacyl-[acyl-carrier-protein] synthase family protein [Pelosinus baikalensis]
MAKEGPVVVTGIGMVTPLGCDYNKVWNSLIEGENGISLLKGSYEEFGKYNIYLAGIASDFSFDELRNLDKHHKAKLKNLNLATKMLVYSGLKALEDANLQPAEDTIKYNIGAIVACGASLSEQYEGIPVEERNPKWFLESYPNLILSYLSMVASLKGYGNTIVSACNGGNQAIGEGFKRIQRGEEKIILVGGVDNKLSSLHASGFSRLGMTTPNNDVNRALRPFDQSRNGFVIGQGACVLVLESLEHAKKRGVDIKGRIVGYGCALDGISITDSSREGKIRAMKMALKDAELSSDEIGYINAHGTSTKSNDSEESIAIKETFGKRAYSIPINSTKSMLGHTFSACGAIEAFVCLRSLADQKVHINRNFEKGDSICNLDYVKDSAREAKMDYCISNTSGLGGYNSSIIFAKV